MHIYINDERKTIKEGNTLENLMIDMKMNDFKGMAIAINDQVLHKDNWRNYKLKNNDSILLIKATQGG